MAKLILISIALMLSACGYKATTPKEYERAVKNCANHGGLKFVAVEFGSTVIYCACNDGAVVKENFGES